jgi:hypothetical protein
MNVLKERRDFGWNFRVWGQPSYLGCPSTKKAERLIMRGCGFSIPQINSFFP